MKQCIIQNKYRLLAFAIVLGIWWGMSQIYSPLVVPPLEAVGREIITILTSWNLWKEIGHTVVRLLSGLGIGVLTGCLSGLLGGVYKPFAKTWKPILGILQVIPPISWLILAIIWFGYNGKASIFIVAIAVLPTIYICITDGIEGIDKRFVEMGMVFEFSRWKKLRYIFIPSVLPYFYSGLKISVGTACKTVVMGEVLTTTSGIGGQIMTARLNIEPETVIAWTVIVVGIYYVAILAGKLWQQLERSLYARYNKLKQKI